MESLASCEGFYVQGSRPERNNNPGAIMIYVQGKQQMKKYNTKEDGFAELKTKIVNYAKKGVTVGEWIYRWSPPQYNNTEMHIACITSKSGVARNEFLSDLL